MNVADSRLDPSGLSVAMKASQFKVVPAYTLPLSRGSTAIVVGHASRRSPVDDQVCPASWVTAVPQEEEMKTVDGSEGDTAIAPMYGAPGSRSGNHSVPPE